MSLQSSEVKLAGAILLRVLTLKKETFNANVVTGNPENILRTLEEISILPLGYCYRAFTQKIMQKPQPQSLWVLKG